MSEEQLKAFLEKVQADTSLKEKLKTAANANAVAVIAKDAGFSISTDEITKVRSQVTTEIADEELEALAAGGMQCATTVPYPDHDWGPAHTL